MNTAVKVNGLELDKWHNPAEKPWVDNSMATNKGYTSNLLAILYEKDGIVHVCEGRYSEDYCCYYNANTNEEFVALAWQELPNKCIS